MLAIEWLWQEREDKRGKRSSKQEFKTLKGSFHEFEIIKNYEKNNNGMSGNGFTIHWKYCKCRGFIIFEIIKLGLV